MIFAAKNIRAARVNLLMNDYAAGLPSPLSFLGLGDALVRDLGLEPWSARTIPILHRVAVSDGRTKPEMESKSGVFMPIETMEDLHGTVDLSLLIDLPGHDSAASLAEALMRRRVAGGIIQNDHIEVAAVTADGSAFRGIKRGYAMVRPGRDRRDQLQISLGDEESLSVIAHTLFPAEREPGNGWVVPVAAGYRLLENPATAPKRIRTRSRDVPHVFAEPILGIAELVSVRNPRLTGLTEDGLDDLFWFWQAQGEFVLGHRNYLPAAMQKEDIFHG